MIKMNLHKLSKSKLIDIIIDYDKKVRNRDSKIEDKNSLHCDMVDAARNTIVNWKIENMVVVGIDNDGEILFSETISTGDSWGLSIRPSALLKTVLQYPNVSYVFLAHNHPLSNTDPSEEDKSTAVLCSSLLSLIDIRLVGFVVISLTDVYNVINGVELYKETKLKLDSFMNVGKK